MPPGEYDMPATGVVVEKSPLHSSWPCAGHLSVMGLVSSTELSGHVHEERRLMHAV
jgi:hypothetical protein